MLNKHSVDLEGTKHFDELHSVKEYCAKENKTIGNCHSRIITDKYWSQKDELIR
jgi:hypothetical protein